MLLTFNEAISYTTPDSTAAGNINAMVWAVYDLAASNIAFVVSGGESSWDAVPLTRLCVLCMPGAVHAVRAVGCLDEAP